MSEQKVVLITGSSSGFGRLATQTLARNGHTVFASMRGVEGKNANAARELRDLAERENLSLHVVEMDVVDDASVEKAVDSVIEAAGRIDVVVNNAGIGSIGVNEAFTIDQVKTIFDVNVLGIQRVNRAVLPHMRKQQSGLLVHLSSALGRFIIPFTGVYAATKYAVEGLAESYRYDLAPLGIDSVIVEPGGYPTEGFVPGMLSGADEEKSAEYGPTLEFMQKFGQSFAEMMQRPDAPNPQEVADAIANLIDTPAGQRPLRTAVGQDTQGVAVINQTTDQVQAQLLEMFGLKELEAVSR